MNILVLNSGSSSLKYRVLAMPAEVECASGEAERVGCPTAGESRLVHREGGREETRPLRLPDIPEAFRHIMDLLGERPALRPDALGHRVVHGGSFFHAPARVDGDVMRKLEQIQNLAPIHNPPATVLIRACRERYPELPQVAVFDTAFHATIGRAAATYALPGDVRTKLGAHKYGFHGTSHQYVIEEAARHLGAALADFHGVSCHLGTGGASLCAFQGGRSVDNTMGFSPLQGLIMSTRCGDLDPAVTLRLLAESTDDAAGVERMLNRRSGVLGLSGVSSDIRDVLADLARAPDGPARLGAAAQAYLWRIRKYLGGYLALVCEPRAVIFTDTVGETMPEVRTAACADMAGFGLELDAARNRAPGGLPSDVAAPDSPVRILVVKTNEELAIARQTWQELKP